MGTKSSKQEDGRYSDLQVLARAGEISNLVRQIVFKAIINEIEVFTYTADFGYFEKSGDKVVEEFKGHLFQRHDFQLRIKVCSALHPELVFRVFVKDKVKHIYKAGRLVWHYRKPAKPRAPRVDRKGSGQKLS